MSDIYSFSDPTYQRTLILGVACGIFFGIFMARESINRQKVYGGVPALIFHYLGASTVSSILPTVIIGIVSGLHFTQLIGMGMLYLLGTITFMTCFGFFESQAEPVLDAKPVRQLD